MAHRVECKSEKEETFNRRRLEAIFVESISIYKSDNKFEKDKRSSLQPFVSHNSMIPQVLYL